jgi:hypothetical protein
MIFAIIGSTTKTSAAAARIAEANVASASAPYQ